MDRETKELIERLTDQLVRIGDALEEQNRIAREDIEIMSTIDLSQVEFEGYDS